MKVQVYVDYGILMGEAAGEGVMVNISLRDGTILSLEESRLGRLTIRKKSNPDKETFINIAPGIKTEMI